MGNLHNDLHIINMFSFKHHLQKYILMQLTTNKVILLKMAMKTYTLGGMIGRMLNSGSKFAS